MAIRQKLADFCAGLSFDLMPDDIVRQAKLCLIDHVCLMIASSSRRSEDNINIGLLVKSQMGKQESSIVGQHGRVPCLNAALVNTYNAADTGLDAIHKSTIIHLSAALVPATLAVAEMRQATGRDFIAALVAGAEVMARVGLALGTRGAYARGFHPTSVCAPFGCAASTGKLLGLNSSQMAEALSTAAVLASGSPLFGGEVHPTSWYLQIARGAQSGVLAAMLAQEGLTGPDMIFEDEQGFLTGYSDSACLAKLTMGLGQSYEIGQLIFKKYGVGIYVVTAIEALERILLEHETRPADIEQITLELPTTVIPRVGFSAYPMNRGSARVSARYIMAVNAYFGTQMAFSMDFSDPEIRQNAGVIALFGKTRVVGSSELDKVFPEKKPCTLTLKTRDGHQYSQRHDGPFKGDPENPLSECEIEAKFDSLATPVIGQQSSDQVKSMIRDLGRVADTSKLVRLLSP